MLADRKFKGISCLSMFFVSKVSLNYKKETPRIPALRKLGEKLGNGVDNNLFESYDLHSMFHDFENVTEIYV